MTIETARRASLEFVCVFGQDELEFMEGTSVIIEPGEGENLGNATGGQPSVVANLL